MARGTARTRELSQLYRETIRQHAAQPIGYRQSIAATHRHEEYNPLCGDRVEIALRVAADRVEAAAFDGEACAICMASASLLCSLAPGRTVRQLGQLGAALNRALEQPAGTDSATPMAESDGLADELNALLGVRPFPSRVQCATLPWTAAHRALAG